jgi:formylglycine-generating enzyme required for sulfatase activity
MLRWTAYDWLNASRSTRITWHEEISSAVPPEFRAMVLDEEAPSPHAYLLPEFTHRTTGTTWVYIPSGSYTMGLSENEEKAARRIEEPPPLNIEEMRPVHRVDVAPFLVMKAPVTWRLVESLLGTLDTSGRPVFTTPRALSSAYLTRPEVDALSSKLGFKLPTEAQWEYMCRAGTTDLFFFGNDLPSGHDVLAEIVCSNLAKSRANPFGIVGLFVGEWCRDRFRKTYDDLLETPDLVVRGGASVFWPWQDSEWAYCISAMRMPSSDLIGGMCGARFVLEFQSR